MDRTVGKEESWPNLFIVGAAKAGTTALHNYLNEHPQVCMSMIKEPHFFADIAKDEGLEPSHSKLVKNNEEYLGLFHCAEKTSSYRGESSPSYLWDINACERIKEKCPDSKIIILLRDPLSRAFSHYTMDYMTGREKRISFYSALQDDLQRVPKGWGISRLYVELGFYSKAVQRFIQYFGPENVKVLFFETFFEDVEKSLNDVYAFLNLPLPSIRSASLKKAYNATHYGGALKLMKKLPFRALVPDAVKSWLKSAFRSKKSPELSEKEIHFLTNYYQKDLLSLANDLGINFYVDYFKRKYSIDLEHFESKA